MTDPWCWYICEHWGYIDGIHATIYSSTMDPSWLRISVILWCCRYEKSPADVAQKRSPSPCFTAAVNSANIPQLLPTWSKVMIFRNASDTHGFLVEEIIRFRIFQQINHPGLLPMPVILIKVLVWNAMPFKKCLAHHVLALSHRSSDDILTVPRGTDAICTYRWDNTKATWSSFSLGELTAGEPHGGFSVAGSWFCKKEPRVIQPKVGTLEFMGKISSYTILETLIYLFGHFYKLN
jgi:hypothetical protein